jgi:hypothetical protein
MNVNTRDVVDEIQELIRGQVTVDDGRLTDPGVPLVELVELARTTA